MHSVPRTISRRRTVTPSDTVLGREVTIGIRIFHHIILSREVVTERLAEQKGEKFLCRMADYELPEERNYFLS